MSKGNCEAVINYITSNDCFNLILAFQNSPSIESYNVMVNGIWDITDGGEQDYLHTIGTVIPPGLIIYVTVADGTLAYNSMANATAFKAVNEYNINNNITPLLPNQLDPTFIQNILNLKLNENDNNSILPGILLPGLNNFYNYQTFNIHTGDNNFNTRGYAMTAMLSTDGIGIEQKWSSAIRQNVTYYAYKTGLSQLQFLGLIIVAIPTI